MPAEVLTIVIGGLVLVVVGVLEAVGVMGVFGAVRFSDCRKCSRLTMRRSAAEPLCRHCRRRPATVAGASGDVVTPMRHRVSLWRTALPHLSRPHTP